MKNVDYAMNILESFDKLNNELKSLLEENKRLKHVQEENQGLKEILKERQNLPKENQKLKEKLKESEEENLKLKNELEKREKERKESRKLIEERETQFQQHVLNLSEENKKLKHQHKNLPKENQELKKKLEEKEKQFQQRVLNLESQKNELKEKILNLEKKKDEQLEIIYQNLEKTLGKLGLYNENDKNRSLIDKLTTVPLIDDGDDSIQTLEDSSKRSSNSFNKGIGTEKSDENSSRSQVSGGTKNNIRADNIRVVVGLDFGTTYSGFSYCHVANQKEITTNIDWPEASGFKTNTVLQYDENYNNVKLWGAPALVEKPSRRKRQYDDNKSGNKPVELFKLHLLCDHNRPHLPDGLHYKKAISDYLREIGKMIKETVTARWPAVDFFGHVLLVLTIPAEFNDGAMHTMRECAYNAGLIKDIHSKNLEFITEPEAAAVYCIRNLKEQALAQPGTNFMVVDCGGGTVDLSTYKLLENGILNEITERTGDYCGSTFIDAEFIKCLERKVGSGAMNLLRENHYGQMQYMVQEFCRRVKLPFTGDHSSYRPYDLDLTDDCPVLLQYVSDRELDNLKEEDWIIELSFDTVKSMFDPIVRKIISLVRRQLQYPSNRCSLIYLTGGFSESEYLQKRIKQEFRNIVVSVPNKPIAAISRGAVMYGLSSNVISTRVLKYTYGIKVRNYWMKGDPTKRKLCHGLIDRFECLAQRGKQIGVDETITKIFTPFNPIQEKVSFKIYYTAEYNAKYCDMPGMEPLGKLTIELPGLGLDKLLFDFTFGTMEITITVKNARTGQTYNTTLNLDI